MNVLTDVIESLKCICEWECAPDVWERVQDTIYDLETLLQETSTTECLMTNCRKQAPKGEVMCSDHRAPPGIITSHELIRAAQSPECQRVLTRKPMKS